MTHKKFIENYGHLLVETKCDNEEYGDYLILYPEEQEKALQWSDTHQLVSIHETENDGVWVDMEQPCDMGNQPFKCGYYVIDKNRCILP